MKVLIINLTRLGDLLQTLPLVRGLRQRGCEVHYLAMSAFSGILKHFEGLDRIHMLDDKSLVENIGSDPWGAYEKLWSMIQSLNEMDFDLILNPVVSIQSSYIAYMLKAREKRGMFYNREGRQVIQSEWSGFHLANEHHLGDRSFNLVDIFARMGGVAAKAENYRLTPPAESRERVDQFWRDHQLDGLQVIGFHIGASRSNKAWEPQKFHTVIRGLLENTSWHVILFGGYNEEPLKQMFADLAHPRFHVLIGETKGLGDLIAHVSRVDLFVTNDTGPMHIAAATGRKILNLSLGPVSLWETGPYTDSAVVLQANVSCHPCPFNHKCAHLECHRLITPGTVSNAISRVMNLEDLPGDERDVLYWRSRKDHFGLQHFVPARPRLIQPTEYLYECKRAIWAISLIRELDPKRDWVELTREYLRKHYHIRPMDFGGIETRVHRLLKLLAEYQDLLRRISTFRRTSEKNVDRIKSTYAESEVLKKRLFTEAEEEAGLFDLFWFARFRESALDADDFAVLTRQTTGIYHNLEMQLRVLLRFLDDVRPTRTRSEDAD